MSKTDFTLRFGRLFLLEEKIFYFAVGDVDTAVHLALTQAGVIVDDSRVVELRMTKCYVPVGVAPYVAVRVEVAKRWDGELGWWAR